MGLALAIFGFIIGIPMLLGAVVLLASGIQQLQNLAEVSRIATPEYIAEFEGEGQIMIVGSVVLTIFAGLIMWGGNRSRRPKVVRLVG